MDKDSLYKIAMGENDASWDAQIAAMNYLGINIIGMPRISDLDGKRWFTYHVEYLMPNGKWGKFLYSMPEDEVEVMGHLILTIKHIRKYQKQFEEQGYRG